MTRKPFQTLREPVMADPVRRVRIEAMERASRIVITLARLHESPCETPPGIAAATDTSELPFPQITDGDSVFLSALKDGIEALGGRLEVAAVFPDRRVSLVE